MSTRPKAKIDPCRAQRIAVDRGQKAVDLTESKLEADPPTDVKRRLEKLLEQQRKTLAAARKALSVCERLHPPTRSTKRKAAPKKKAAKRKAA